MASKTLLTAEVISQAESYDGIRAGIIRLNDYITKPFSNTALVTKVKELLESTYETS